MDTLISERPAACFADGKVSGLLAEGGFEVSMEWAAGRLSRTEILSRHGGECKIKLPGGMLGMDAIGGRRYVLDQHGRMVQQ